MSDARRIGSCLLLAALIALVSGHAAADKTQSRAAADALFREAVVLADSGKFDQAISKFSASYELDPARGTLLGLAMSEEKAGRVLDSLTHFRKLLEAAEQANDKARVDVAKEHLEALRIRVPSLTVSFGDDVPLGTSVSIDDEKLPPGAIGSALPINPGDHRVVAKTPDGRTFARVIGVSEGARTKIEITWQKPKAEPALPPPTQATSAVAPEQTSSSEDGWASGSNLRTAGLIAGGVGALAIGIGAYLWIDSGHDYNAVNDSCQNKVCTADEQDKIDSGHNKERWGRILLIGGGVAVAGGITLFVIGSRSERRTAVRGMLGPSGAAIRGCF